MHLFDDVRVTTLNNGMTVISDHDPQAYGLAACIRICTGNHHDRDDKMGIAHVGEHMTVNGIPGINVEEFYAEMAGFGMRRDTHYGFDTGTIYTDFWVEGSVEGSVHFLNRIASAIRNQAYMPQVYVEEQARLIKETKEYLEHPGFIMPHRLYRALFGNGALARWQAGGLPDHVASMSFNDVRDYHAKSLVSDNVLLFTSGTWAHEQAQTFADGFSSLGRGKRYKKVKSPFQPHDVREPMTWLPDATNFFIAANIGSNKSFNPVEWKILKDHLNTQFKNLARRTAVYHGVLTIAETTPNPDTMQVAISPHSAWTAEAVPQLIQQAVDILNDSYKTLTPSVFEHLRHSHLLSEQLRMGFERHDVRQRLPLLRAGFYHYDDALRTNGFEERVAQASHDGVMKLLTRIRSSAIATGYLGVQRPDFPDGEDIARMMRGPGSFIVPRASVRPAALKL